MARSIDLTDRGRVLGVPYRNIVRTRVVQTEHGRKLLYYRDNGFLGEGRVFIRVHELECG
jgi:hypothetical protein